MACSLLLLYRSAMQTYVLGPITYFEKSEYALLWAILYRVR